MFTRIVFTAAVKLASSFRKGILSDMTLRLLMTSNCEPKALTILVTVLATLVDDVGLKRSM